MTPKKSVLTAAMAGALIVGVSACGSDSDSGHFEGKEPAEIAEESRKAMLGLDSLTMDADIDFGDGTKMTLEASFTSDGECSGTMSQEGEGSAEFVSVDGSSYFKGDDEFWASQGPDAAAIADATEGRWLKSPVGTSQFDTFCSLDELLSDLDTNDTEESDWESIDGETIDGTKAVGVSNVKDPENVSHLYIADNEDAHILRLTREDGGGEVLFKDFNKDFTFEAPADDEVVDIEELG